MCVYVHACLHKCVCACVLTYIHMCVHACIHTLCIHLLMCLVSSVHRPVAGFANICVNRALEGGIENLRSILFHEITHALVSVPVWLCVCVCVCVCVLLHAINLTILERDQ